MFDQFKASHGGFGPFQVAAGVLSGLDWHSLAAVQKQWDDTFNAIGADDSLPSDFKSEASTLRAGKYPVSKAIDILSGLQEKASGIKAIQQGLVEFNSSLDELDKSAVTPEDKAQIKNFRSSAQTVHDYMLSSDPKVQALGMQMAPALISARDQFSAQNEAQSIAAKNKFGDDNWARFQNLNTDSRAQNATFVQQQGAMDRITKIAQLPRSGAGDRALVMNALQVIRPGVVVRGDGSDLDNLEGVDPIMKTLYSRVFRDGKLLEDKDYADLLSVTGAAYSAGRDEQFKRNAAVTNAAHAAGLPEELINPLIQPLGDAPQYPAATGDKTPPPQAGDFGAKVLTTLAAANEAVPDSVKQGLGIAGGLSLPGLAKNIPAIFENAVPVAALAGMYTLLKNKPPQMPGEDDQQYADRLSAMMAGEDIFSPRAKVYKQTDEFR